MQWQTARREFQIDTALVMAIMNVTPDSFSDGGRFASVNDALRQAELMVAEGADIIDIGGESTRPGSSRVEAEDEIKRVVPVIDAISRRFDVAVSVDTSKAAVAKAAMDAGAEIINDISGLVFDPDIAGVAAETRAGLVLMHLRGTFETMHAQEPVGDILEEVARGFRSSIATAIESGVTVSKIALDVGIGFSKTFEQNLELLAKIDKLASEFSTFPILVGTSRKSFLGKIMDQPAADQRLSGSLASAAIAVWHGARIVRVHDVRETVEAIKVVRAIRAKL